MRVLFGGPADGRTVNVEAVGVNAPVITTDYSRAHRAWFTEFGEAHAISQASDLEWTGPPQPSIPVAHYVPIPGVNVYAYAGMH